MNDIPLNVKVLKREPFHEIRFSRPEAMNTLTLEMIEEFYQALASIESDLPRCVLLTAEGKNFMAGGDLAYLRDAGDDAPAEADVVIDALNRLFTRLVGFPCPTVIAMQGAVAGAGISLMLACDWAVAAKDSRFVFAYDKIATTPDGGLTWMLPRAVGIKQALRIALSSKPLIAEEVFQLGLLAKLVPAGEVQQAGEAAATRLAGGPTLAYSATRKLMLDSFDRDFKSHLDAELTSFCRQAATSDFHGAVKAFFDRRKPEFRGR